MQIPHVDDPERYCGLYVFDFGEWSAMGYTAEEIAMLLEDEQYASGKVYRIHGASPDGSMELYAVAAGRFGLESGMAFFREVESIAREDFATLSQAADEAPPPCRAYIRLLDRGESADRTRYAVVLVYPSEFDSDVASWLLAAGYHGGDTVEGGMSVVSNLLEEDSTILERKQLWSRASHESRERSEVMRTVRTALQR